VATSNPHKIQEFRDILAPFGVTVVTMQELGRSVSEPEEAADTFAGNARLKAQSYARALGRLSLGDDSGLEVDALGGAPGVLSARYAGALGTREERDRANNQKLLTELAAQGVTLPRARLVCALCLADAQGRVVYETTASFDGVILDQPRGARGFGYDAYLYLPELGKAAAELTPTERDAHSHRAKATRALLNWLQVHDALG